MRHLEPIRKSSFGSGLKLLQDGFRISSYDYEVVVVTSNLNGKKQIIEEYCRIKVYCLPILLRIANTPVNPLWYLTLKRIIRAGKPDIINSHQLVPFIGDLTAFVTGNIPFVWDILAKRKSGKSLPRIRVLL